MYYVHAWTWSERGKNDWKFHGEWNYRLGPSLIYKNVGTAFQRKEFTERVFWSASPLKRAPTPSISSPISVSLFVVRPMMFDKYFTCCRYRLSHRVEIEDLGGKMADQKSWSPFSHFRVSIRVNQNFYFEYRYFILKRMETGIIQM